MARGQWKGDQSVHNLVAGADVASVIQLVPTLSDVDIQQDVVMEVSHIHLSIRRLLASTLDACGYVIWMGKTLVSTTVPAQGLDPLSQSTFAWADKDIMLQGLLPIPPVQLNSADVNQIRLENLHVYIKVKSKRRFNRANHGIFLALSADVSNVIRVVTSRRTFIVPAAD